MYCPDHFRIEDQKTIDQIIDDFGFAILVSNVGSNEAGLPSITHLPLLRDGSYLYGHMARPNHHWKLLEQGVSSTAIFQGPHGYVSPKWYQSENRVPTWNYATVHVTGQAEILREEDANTQLMESLVSQYEGVDGWSTAQVSDKALAGLRRGIICFRLSMEQVECKVKMDQNKTEEDRKSVAETLRATGRDNDQDLARWMEMFNA